MALYRALLKKSLRILLVEDDPILMHIHRTMVQSLGYTVDEATTGAEALKNCRNDYDLILMDIGLPDIDGIGLTTKIRQIEKLQHKKAACIVGVTAYSLEEVQLKSLRAGMNALYTKPITINQLQDLLVDSHSSRCHA